MSRGVCVWLLVAISLAVVYADDKIYRMCVPKDYYNDCVQILQDPSEAGLHMECVAGRDRIDCLDLVNQRKADLLASEPEDMYVAYHKKNQDYRVISEIRTQNDAQAPFRYEGIILVKKDSKFNSLESLRGAKSCHTGFGRNVGYRIPITKLKNAKILKVSLDNDITASERELKALSEFFTKSCLVGKYSPYPETDRLLKKKYANLCELCQFPEKCDYPDDFSGYDGAIRCLDKGQGEVAFSKVQYIKKYFGSNGKDKAEGDASQFEYLCEDGTRRAVTGPACSWAKRPWMGYLTNADVTRNEESLHSVQDVLEQFFTNGLHTKNKDARQHLLINDDAVYHSKPEAVDPQSYLEKAGYKDVIERDGSAISKLRLCVQTDVEMSKCKDLHAVSYSRDIRPEIECVQEKDCINAVKADKADFVAVRANNYADAKAAQLMPIIYEDYGNQTYVAVVDPSLSASEAQTAPATYDNTNERARLAAAWLNKQRGLKSCQPSSGDKKINIVNAKELENHKDKQLLCTKMDRKAVTEFSSCNWEAQLPTTIFIRESLNPVQKETIKHLFISMSKKFDKDAKMGDIFLLFGEYKKNYNNVIFDDDAQRLVTNLDNINIREQIYHDIKCEVNDIKKN